MAERRSSDITATITSSTICWASSPRTGTKCRSPPSLSRPLPAATEYLGAQAAPPNALSQTSPKREAGVGARADRREDERMPVADAAVPPATPVSSDDVETLSMPGGAEQDQ